MLRDVFDFVDVDKGGTISIDELQQLMTTLGLQPSQEELKAMMDDIDMDGNGEIDFDEFVTAMSRKEEKEHTPAQIKAAFKLFEKQGAPSGCVSMRDLETALATKLSLFEAQELLAQVDPDEDGMINYVDFVDTMTSTG